MRNCAAAILSKTFITLLWCVLFFIVLPLIIYILSYIPYMQVTDNPYDFNDILHNQEYMFNYHAHLKPDHVCIRSHLPWYLWPIDYRPLFCFQGQGYPDAYMSSMSSMGNHDHLVGRPWRGDHSDRNPRPQGPPGAAHAVSFIAALSEYLPWVLVSRETFHLSLFSLRCRF